MRKILTALAVTLGLFHQAHALPLLNGGFESPSLVNPTFAFDVGVAFPTNFITGWTVTQGTVDLTGTCCIPAHSGVNSVDLVGSGFGNGAITQTFTTVAGQQYDLTFWYTHNFGASAASFSANAIVKDSSNAVLQTTSVTHNLASTLANPNWTLSSSLFTALSTTTTLTFLNTAGAFNGGIYLDDVSIDPVNAVNGTPIPGALPLFASGLGALCLLTWRRKRKTFTA
jgi:hypothetical protein